MTGALFVFSVNGPIQNARSLLTPVSEIFMLVYMVACILFSITAPITAYVKYSDWLMKNFNQ